MLTNLHIKSFKSFLDERIEFKNLTLLCGFNNSGKSSVVQALRMYCNAYDIGVPLLPGHGSIDELRSRLAPPNDPIVFEACFDDGVTSEYRLSKAGFGKPEKSPVCYYLSADRLGPQVTLPVEQRLNRFPAIGAKGEYVVGFLESLRDFIIPDFLRHEKAQGVTLEYQLVGWLGEIAPGVELTYRIDEKRDSAYFEFNTFRPSNVGFGLSYCLPILAAVLGLTATPPKTGWKDTEFGEEVGLRWEQERKTRGTLLLIENPEAHLHPKGQTALGKFIAAAAMCGVQFVIETQSDHLMDGIRIAVKQSGGDTQPDFKKKIVEGRAPDASIVPGKLDIARPGITPDHVIFHYLEKSESGKTILQTPILEKNGKLSFWPEGFFDQTLKNRSVLAR